ncbi:MAG: 2OG-Fe(II) oxygenase family protein, partial [Pseudomonadota bacterium]|nr:2OG-Fe(II) oxygenase family protein [Pseudomonadota bacterium]
RQRAAVRPARGGRRRPEPHAVIAPPTLRPQTLRPEVLRHVRADGGVDLYDPLLERLTSVPPAEVAALADLSASPTLAARLADALLLEGPVADELRRRVWAARALPLAEAPVPPPVHLDPALAAALPAPVAPAWRDPEAWRRLGEDRAAGRARLVLRGLLSPADAAALAAEVRALPFTRFETDRVHAWRAVPPAPGDAPSSAAPPALTAWRALLHDHVLRALVGGALGVGIPAGLVANAWRMGPGDGMRAHPDGRRYAATWALGLTERWTAADGGAIAFGTPTPDGFVVDERWLPYAGDLCLFVPDAESWHVVEPPRRERLTLSGWWVAG